MKTNKHVLVEGEEEVLFSFRKKQISPEKIDVHWKMIHEKIKQYEKQEDAKKPTDDI